MAICLFTEKYLDGSGDIVQTVKIADFIEKYIESSKLEEFKNEITIIVVEDDENKEIVSRFVKDINPNIQVKKILELKEENHKINCCIEAGYSHFDWKKYLSFTGTEPPLILMPEYDNNVSHQSGTFILGGFDKSNGDVGVIPSLELLNATAGEGVGTKILKNAFKQLEPKLQSYLGKDFQSHLTQRQERDFSYQYSHDSRKYPTFYKETVTPYKAYLQYKKVIPELNKYTPVDFFLQEHIMLTTNSAKSQDVLCIGENPETKLEALKKLINFLKKTGYSTVSFINIDTGKEEVIYKSNTNGKAHKEYRVLYSKSIPFSSMQALPLIATDIVGVTGDQSLVEAMSAKKLVTYECKNHKKGFARGYLDAVNREVSKMTLAQATKIKVSLLAELLIKRTGRINYVKYNQQEVFALLIDRSVVDALKHLNRQLVEKSKYFASIKKVLESEVLSYIKANSVKKISSSQETTKAKPKSTINKEKLVNTPESEKENNEPTLDKIKNAVQRACNKYSRFQKNLHGSWLFFAKRDKEYSRGEFGYFTRFRHGKAGLEKTKKLLKDIKRAETAETAEESIKTLLTKSQYNRHSFESFLLDELKKIDNSPWSGIQTDDNNKYNKVEVIKKFQS